MKILTNGEFSAATGSGYCLVDFFAEWCMPCKMLAPFFEEAEKELNALNVSLYKVDVDASDDIAESFGIAAVPTVILLKDGKVVNNFSGLKRPKQIVDFVKENI